MCVSPRVDVVLAMDILSAHHKLKKSGLIDCFKNGHCEQANLRWILATTQTASPPRLQGEFHEEKPGRLGYQTRWEWEVKRVSGSRK